MGRQQILADLHEFGLDPKKAHKLNKDRLQKPVQTKEVTAVTIEVLMPILIEEIKEIVSESAKIEETITDVVDTIGEVAVIEEISVVIPEIIETPTIVEIVETADVVADEIIKKTVKKKKKETIE